MSYIILTTSSTHIERSVRIKEGWCLTQRTNTNCFSYNSLFGKWIKKRGDKESLQESLGSRTTFHVMWKNKFSRCLSSKPNCCCFFWCGIMFVYLRQLLWRKAISITGNSKLSGDLAVWSVCIIMLKNEAYRFVLSYYLYGNNKQFAFLGFDSLINVLWLV